MECRVEIITPMKAIEYLQLNKNNYRSCSEKVVNAYAEDMKLGLWKTNGEPIIFKKNGELADGQHRLFAVIKSHKDVEMLVVRDIDDNINTFDVGKQRTVNDILKADGLDKSVANATVVGAVNLALKYKRGRNKLPKQKTVEVIMKNNDRLKTAYSATIRAKSKLSRKSGCVLAAFYLLNHYDEEELFKFFTVVNTGFPIEYRDCSSAIVLRNFLVGDKYKMHSHDGYVQEIVFSYTLSAFNDFYRRIGRTKSYKVDDKNMEILQGIKELFEMQSR